MKINVKDVNILKKLGFPLRGYIDIRSVMTYRTTQWFDAVTASDALPGEGKLSAKLTDEVA